jgi:LysM repeat protein
LPEIDSRWRFSSTARRLASERRRPMAVARRPVSRWRPVLALLIFASALVGAPLAVWHSEVDQVDRVAVDTDPVLDGDNLSDDFAPQLGPVSRSDSPYAGIAQAPPTPTPGRLQATSYEIQDGDTLLEIAEHFGLRSETLLWANDLPDPDLIVIGQKLIIPPVDGLIYEIETGELLSNIVARYGLDLDQVALANGIGDPNDVQVGTNVILPGARPVARSRVVGAGPNTAPDSGAAVDSAALASLVLQQPLPDNVGQLLAASWVRTGAPNALYSGPGLNARRYVSLPSDIPLERTGDLAGRRIPVRDPGDGRSRQAMSGWIDVDALEPTRAPAPRELPRAYPADTRMDIAHNFVPYRGQLDGSAYAEANCGPTSIGMVLESFGINLPLSRLRADTLDAQQMWGNGTGTLMTALAEVVEDHGLRVYDLRREGELHRWTLDDLRAQLRLRRPVVVQTRYRALPGREGSYYAGDHYIVVTGVLDDGFLYNDPIDFDGPGWDRVISGDRLDRAMDASDTRFAHAAFASGL